MHSDHTPPTMPRMVVAVLIGLMVFEVVTALFLVVADFFLASCRFFAVQEHQDHSESCVRA